MGELHVGKLSESTHAKLRSRAALRRRSVAAEVRAILDEAVEVPRDDILVEIHQSFAGGGGLDLELSMRHGHPRQADLS